MKAQVDTLAKPAPVNKGKIAGNKAFKRSLILPGLGQAYNYGLIVDDIKTGRLKTKGFGKKLAIIGKIGGIYVAGTMLTLSYIENDKNYRLFLKELQYRQLNNGEPDPNGSLAGYRDTQNLYTGKAIYKNNREVVLVFIGVTYAINVVDAYVTARLKYLNVEESLGFQIRPSLINSNTMYGYHSFTPALKLTLKL
ncbi:MAG: hypothetical protein KAY27_03640 [Pedobacter sp.]|nr:hypothetical protein [Pedobacter sp.]